MDISSSIDKLCRFIERDNFSGYDPYDALNSSVISFLSFGQKYGRIAWTQFMRRLPVNLRPLFLVPKGHNPKGIGLFLGGYSRLYRIDRKQEHLEKIEHLLRLVSTLRSDGYSGNCWGYNFDWQSRAFFIPMYTPTIVNSSFIGHALLDTYEFTGLQAALDLAIPISNFILNDLHRTREGDNFCFSYTPIDKTAVHNANLLGASLLIRLYKKTGDEKMREAALASLAYSMQYQHEDGAWYYAETDIQKWIDSFHTGFNLESIRWFLNVGEGEEYRDSYKQGVKYYVNNFFLDDGTPKYYNDRTYPIDIHSPTEAIVFFCQEGREYRQLTERILSWMIGNMQAPEGYFYFRKGKYITNKIPYMRWGQAWAFHALSSYFSSVNNRTGN